MDELVSWSTLPIDIFLVWLRNMDATLCESVSVTRKLLVNLSTAKSIKYPFSESWLKYTINAQMFVCLESIYNI